MNDIKNKSDLIKELRHILSLLENISKEYAEDTEEYAAIEIAAKSLFYIGTGTEKEVSAFISLFNQPLSKEQIMHLEEMNLKPHQ